MNNKNKKTNSGLTMVELLVVISIFLVISGVTIFNYGKFRTNISLQNLTDDIALSIRKAQSFAIGARSSSTVFTNSFGIHLSVSSTETNVINGNNKSFIMFSADPTSRKYVAPGGASCVSPCVEQFKINTADIVKEIWVDDVKQSDVEGSVDVVFTRPDPRAYFCYRSIPTSSTCTTASSVKIVISNGQIGTNEKTRIIAIQNTGQISTQ